VNVPSGLPMAMTVWPTCTVDTSPIWAIVGLLLIAAVIGGLFYVFRTYGRR
jgi:uncharacterized membrane protein